MVTNIYYTVYKTINLINHKEYIGKHITSNPDDRYIGSGEAIRDAIKKYGRRSFSKEILFLAFDEVSMEWVEAYFVDKDYVAREDTYNLRVGGRYSPVGNLNGKRGGKKGQGKGKIASEVAIVNMSAAKMGNTNGRGNKGKPKSEEAKSNISSSKKGNQYGKGNKGKPKSKEHRAKLSAAKIGNTLSDEAKSKISVAMRGNQYGKKNTGKPKKRSVCNICGESVASNCVNRHKNKYHLNA